MSEKNEIALTGAQKLQVQLISELDSTAKEIGQEFTPYGSKCMINAIGGIVALTKANGINIQDIDSTLLRLQIQNIGYTELNLATQPAEVYIDIRKNYRKEGDTKTPLYSIAIKPQGAGNEKLVRKYGVGLVKGTGLHPAWLVREGDDFEYPYFDGLKMTPPKWRPHSYDKKVIMVVYPCEKVDGSIEYLIATREGIKPNLIAQIRQTTLHEFKKPSPNGKYEVDDEAKRNEFYEKVNNAFETMTVDEILADPEWSKWLTPTYTSGGSREAMIIRKMKNNALKNYPKEYDSSAICNAVEGMFEDRDDSLKVKKNDDIIENVEADINAPVNEDAPKDFEVDEDGVVKKEEKVVEAVIEKKVDETANAVTEALEQDPYVEGEQEEPDWMN